METVIYQGFSHFVKSLVTIVEIFEDGDAEVSVRLHGDSSRVLDDDDCCRILTEIRRPEFEKASWSDGENDPTAEDYATDFHNKWREINSFLDDRGL